MATLLSETSFYLNLPTNYLDVAVEARDMVNAGITESYINSLLQQARRPRTSIIELILDIHPPFQEGFEFYKYFWSSFNCRATSIHSTNTCI